MPFRKKKTDDKDSTQKPKTSLLHKLRRRDGKKDKAVTEAQRPPLTIPQQNQKSKSTPNSGVKPQQQTALKTIPTQTVSINTLPIRDKPPQTDDPQAKKCHCRHGKKSLFSSLRSDAPPPPSNAKSCVCCGRCQKCAANPLLGAYPRCNLCKSKSPLLSLPSELQDEIFSHLPLSSTWLLRLASRVFYHYIAAPIGPLEYAGTLVLFTSLRPSIPSNLIFCLQCMRYHPWTPNEYYTYREAQYCVRDLSRTRRAPLLPSHVVLGLTHYICLHCRAVRGNRSCVSCAKCECCAGVKFQGHSVECIECDAGKARCTECKALRLQHRGCKGCGKCENCADRLFQFGVIYCAACGGGWHPVERSTKKVLVETGPGYEMFHYRGGDGGGGGRREGRIGIR